MGTTTVHGDPTRSRERPTRCSRIVTQVAATETMGGDEPPSFEGFCAVCGWAGRFCSSGEVPGRVSRDFQCGGCGSPLVYQAEAGAILDAYAVGAVGCLDDLVQDATFQERAVFHIGHAGPVRNRLKRLTNYEESCFDATLPRGELVQARPRRTNQDHQRLTFADDRFDLLVSSHVLEHVPVPRAALVEAHRTLKPGGRYIFSIPGNLGHHESVIRAGYDDGRLVHHLPPRYHHSPEGEPALVFTDFGTDLLDLLHDVGFVAFVDRPHRPIRRARQNFVIVAIKAPRRRRMRAWRTAITRRPST